MHRIIALLALITALCFAPDAIARTHGGGLNPQGPTGSSGNGLGHFAGYSWTCPGTAGCSSSSGTIVVPTLQYDTGGGTSGCNGAICGYIWTGINDIGSVLAQDGVSMETSGGGVFTYRAWWECLTINNVQYTFDAGATLNINAGDTVTSSVTCTNCTAGSSPPSPQAWTFTVNDVTKGQSVSKTGFNCPLANSSFYSVYWVTETNDVNNIVYSDLTFSSALVNGANPNFSQGLYVRCGSTPCGRYEFTTGASATGTTINPSVPSATTDGFKLCVNSNGKPNYNGTTNFIKCAAPP